MPFHPPQGSAAPPLNVDYTQVNMTIASGASWTVPSGLLNVFITPTGNWIARFGTDTIVALPSAIYTFGGFLLGNNSNVTLYNNTGASGVVQSYSQLDVLGSVVTALNQTLPAGATFTPEKGVIIYHNQTAVSNSLTLQAYVAGSWVTLYATSNQAVSFYTDGGNLRILNNSASSATYDVIKGVLK